MRKKTLGCFMGFFLVIGIAGCGSTERVKETEVQKEDTIREEQTVIEEKMVEGSVIEEVSRADVSEETTIAECEDIISECYDLSGVTFNNDDKLNDVIEYVNEYILDDFLDGGKHFKAYIARNTLEKDGYVGFDEGLLDVFYTDLMTTVSNAEVVYVSDAEDMGNYYRIGICTVLEEDTYLGKDFYYNDFNYCAFYASVFEENGAYYILPFDYLDADLYAPIFGCAKGISATGVQTVGARRYLLERISNEAACQDTDREIYAQYLAELEEESDYYNRPENVTEEIIYLEPPVLTYE